MRAKHQTKLKHYYANLGNRKKSPQQIFREKVIETCKISNQTFYRWLSGQSKPSELKKNALSKITGIPSSELFN